MITFNLLGPLCGQWSLVCCSRDMNGKISPSQRLMLLSTLSLANLSEQLFSFVTFFLLLSINVDSFICA